MKTIAILGATASGKSKLSIEIAKDIGANILSLDSLSIYKEVNILSAKPTKNEMQGVKHFGIDEIYINEYFSAATFFDIYKTAKKDSEDSGKHLIITGGSSFYLKSMIDGLSPKINISDKTQKEINFILMDMKQAYKKIELSDLNYAKAIKPNDKYRIQKWYEIYIESGQIASEYFKQNKRKAIIKDIKIFNILIDRKELRERIKTRTSQMLKDGLIDEVFSLEKRYTREPIAMKSIGSIETLEYLDGKIDINELNIKISTHTAQLAKRQESFNKTQFNNIESYIKKDLKNKLLSYF